MQEIVVAVDKMKKKLDRCRLCFSSTNVTVHIGQHVDNNTSIAEKIQYCTSLIVKVGDYFPQNICTTCAENLDLIYNFKSKAISCDLELSRNLRKDIYLTNIQVSVHPLTITYQQDLKEQNSSTDLFDSCSKITNNDSKKSDVIEKKWNGNLKTYRGSKTNNQKKSISVDLKRNSDKSLFDDNKCKSKKKKIGNEIVNKKPLVIVKNGKDVYICSECCFEAETMMCLVSHRARFHLQISNFKCSECSTYFQTSRLLKKHITSMHHNATYATYVCKFCQKKYLNKRSLDYHTKTNHKFHITPLEFQCVICNAYFDTITKMEDHLVVHYANPSSKFSCNSCDCKFPTYAAKTKHSDLEHMIEIECGICHVVLPTEEAMDKHNNSVHQPKEKENKCPTREKYLSGKKVLSYK